jgi:hypothetical protein
MAPWMVIVGLIGTGFVVLLVAPTIHRSINAKSRAEAEAARVERANALRNTSSGATRELSAAASAVRARDRLLLRGVRAEVVHEGGRTLLIFNVADSAVVDEVIDELGID